MYYKSYFHRILIASIVAIVITFTLGLLVMWLNGFVDRDEINTVEVFSVCKFDDENTSNEIKNPFLKENIEIKCENEDETKPLILEWFDRLFNEDFDKNYIRKNPK